jgi:hypothetical protein
MGIYPVLKKHLQVESDARAPKASYPNTDVNFVVEAARPMELHHRFDGVEILP